MNQIHEPVLVDEVLLALDPKENGFYVDGTIDGGGHASRILEKIGEGGKLLGVDRDPEMLNLSKERFAGRKNVIFASANYADLPELLKDGGFGLADGLLLDLGFSSAQLENGRGFGFSKDEPLCMTYDPEATPAAELLRSIKEEELASIIKEYGGERMSGRVARAIVEAEKHRPIETTGELALIVRNALPKSYERGRIDPATRTFQAIRIYANRELENLEKVIGELSEIVKPGGKVAIISFHSLEDRIVKENFKTLAKKGKLEIISKKPITAAFSEKKKNPRSRSAKLRAAIIKQINS